MENHGSLIVSASVRSSLDGRAETIIIKMGRKAPQKLVDEIWLALRSGDEPRARRSSLLLRAVEAKLAM